MRARESEARDELARGKARQEVGLLLWSAVANEELAGAETVGHRHCRVGITAFGAQLRKRETGAHSLRISYRKTPFEENEIAYTLIISPS